MDGITVHSENIIYQQQYAWWWIPITALIFVIAFAIKGALDDELQCQDVIYLTIIGLIIGILIGAFIGALIPSSSDEIDYVEYKVTISDDVPFNEFSQKYIVISQEGNIYTVRERNG